jgi:NAD(P)H-hydrate epimerase
VLDCSVAEISSDRMEAARRAARELGAVVLLKGRRTIVAHPSGRAAVNPTGGAELATAGTGDVLTGAVSALAAAGLDDMPAAWAACFVHGLAGSVAASSSSPSGVVAWDVAESLPQATRLVQDHGILV